MSCINNEPVVYKDLPKIQKLAVFLVALGPESASQVLSRFEDSEIEYICREISKLKVVDASIKDEALEDFSNIIAGSLGSILGGMGFAQKALELSRVGSRAGNIMGKIAPGSSTADLIQKVSDLEPLQIYNIFVNEQSQTLAFILSHIGLEKSTKLVGMLSEDKRQDVLEHMGGMRAAPIEMVAKIAEAIRPHLKDPETQNIRKGDGIRMVADMLNNLDKDMGKSFLAKLGDSNPELSAAIGKKMFSFADLVLLSIPDLQRVAREIEMGDLVLALKTASKELEAALMKSVSKRAAESLKEELSMLGPVKVKAVEEAQDRIIQAVKRLEEEGAIELGQSEGDVIE